MYGTRGCGSRAREQSCACAAQLSGAVMTFVGKKALIDLSEAYADCDLCPLLCASRSEVVFGSGAASAPIVVVGEAPGGVEDAEGTAFVGDSGQLLMDLLAKAWPDDEELKQIRKIEEDSHYFRELREYLDRFIFWTNSTLCRPPEGRNPTPQELKNCRDRLDRTIYAVDPLLIIAVLWLILKSTTLLLIQTVRPWVRLLNPE